MLARFAALAKQAEEEKRIEQEAKEKEAEEARLKEEKEKQFSSWQSNAKKPEESPLKSPKVDTYDTEVKMVDKCDLVWAPCHVMKGKSSSYAMARVCEFGEAALEPHIEWPIPDNHVLVEFFCLPIQNFTRFAVIPPTKKQTSIQRCLPFNAPLKKGCKQGTIIDAFSTEEVKSEHNEWDPDRVTAFYNDMKVKYNVHTAQKITHKCRKVANAFLKLALEKRSTEAVYEEARKETDLAIAQSREILRQSSEVAGDLSRYTLKTPEGGTERKRKKLQQARTLAAGDYIEYLCKIFKVSKVSQILRITPSATYPLTLASDDLIYQSDLIVKCTPPPSITSSSGDNRGDSSNCGSAGSSKGGSSIASGNRRSSRSSTGESIRGSSNSSCDGEEEELGSCPLSDFTLQAGSINVLSTQEQLARQTKAHLKAIAQETGVTLNTARPKKRPKSSQKTDINTSPSHASSAPSSTPSKSFPPSRSSPRKK